ncbi:probable phosphopantothenoylcysteine decarboxylase [Abrus precatorius]|uniref:phosphopantothenoylcysteine decarboxylase n=1 Tax=Abrus precatorius TaxID=3816 RepID=A0A8B8K5G2_ABRPR|nr:probable phosphopantothenoylcysteine decarboxylase [Abrus precatorius]
MDCSDPASEAANNEAGFGVKRKPRILLAATGSVAAVKFSLLCHCFIEWAEVRAVVTQSSLRFFDALSVPKDVFVYYDEHEQHSWKKEGDFVLHIEICKWAEIMVIAPLSANTLAKIAGGVCDNLVTCIVQSWDYKRPLFVAPSMNTFMWENPFTQRHCTCLGQLGISLIPPVAQRKSEEEYANGAMAEPSNISLTVKNCWRKSSI